MALNVFVLIDALGWRYVEHESFLEDFLPVRKRLKTVLGYSSGAIPTILTGHLPAQTGHWNLFYYDPENAPFKWLRFLRWVPRAILNSRISRKALTLAGRRLFGLGPLFDCAVSPHVLRYFNWSEKRNIYEPRGLENARSIFDEIAASGIPHRAYSYHRYTDAEILERAQVDLRNTRAQFYFLYLSELDAFLHDHCRDLNAVRARLSWYAERLRNVFATARAVDPAAGLTIFSDHGMTPVLFRYDLKNDIDAAGFREPKDYLVVYDSTMARFWFWNDRAREEIIHVLQRAPCGSVLTNDELRRLGVFFPDGRYGHVIFLVRPGWLLDHSHFHDPGWMPKGMHGYHPDDPDSDGVFLNDGRFPRVQSIAQVYACMAAAADLRSESAAAVRGV